MKKWTVLAFALLSVISMQAQHKVNSFFDQLGVIRLETQELQEDTIVTISHRSDDVVWARVVYRIIDMRYKQNYPLYFPVQANDSIHRNLLNVMVRAVGDGMKVWEKSNIAGDIKPNFRVEPWTLEQTIMVLNSDRSGDIELDVCNGDNLLLNCCDGYASGKAVFNGYSFEEFATNQLKWLIQEVVFFDKHYSRLYTKIMAIAPMHEDQGNFYDDMNVMEAIYNQILFWVPFDSFRPYMAGRYTISSKNEVQRVTFDEFFTKKLYTSYLVGEQDMYNRMITDYTKKDAKLVKQEQDRIQTELLNFEQDLWEY